MAELLAYVEKHDIEDLSAIEKLKWTLASVRRAMKENTRLKEELMQQKHEKELLQQQQLVMVKRDQPELSGMHEGNFGALRQQVMSKA